MSRTKLTIVDTRTPADKATDRMALVMAILVAIVIGLLLYVFVNAKPVGLSFTALMSALVVGIGWGVTADRGNRN